MSGVSIIVPTYREVESLPHLIDRLESLRSQPPELELLLMDDDSSDGTEALVERPALPWVRLVVRKRDRGLARAVVDGRDLARGDTIVVVDADLRHPPEAVPAMVATAIARPFTNVKGPISGFIAVRRALVAGAAPLDPIGYKIALELIVKCGVGDVVEIPIRFADRRHGESKLSLREQLAYLRHVARPAAYRLTAR